MGIGSSGTGTGSLATTATTTLASSLSMSSSHRGSISAPSPRGSATGPSGVALPGHLKMKTGRPTPPQLPAPAAPPGPSSDDVPPQPGDPSPSRPRPAHQALPGGTVSRLTAHLSPSRSNSRDGGVVEGGILNIDLTSDNEAEEDRQQQQQQQQQQQRKGRGTRRLEKEVEESSSSSSEDESGSSHHRKHKPMASSPSKSSSSSTGGSRRRRGIGELAQAAITKLGGNSKSAAAAAAATAKSYTERKFEELMAAEVVDLGKLRELSWGGIPDRHRGTIWRLLLGYLPANRDRREATQTRKRREYAEILPLYFNIAPEERTMQEQEILRQILVDLPRTQPDMPLFHQEEIQRCMERILYVWAIRHPASGYVQGMNDLVVPLILVFLAERLMHSSPSSDSSSSSSSPGADSDYYAPSLSASSSRAGWSASGAAAAEAQALDVSKVPHEVLEQVEADVYWCITKLLDNIQDHYTFSQPGLQRMIFRLQALIERHDPVLHRHLEEEGLQYVQFAFRWMNCLLIRELSLDAIIRIWDTELAEEAGGFEAFHVYLCAAFLLRFSEHLRTLPFQDLVLFLQDVPTHDWTLHEIEPLLSQAHVLRSLYPEFGQPGGARTIPGRGGK